MTTSVVVLWSLSDMKSINKWMTEEATSGNRAQDAWMARVRRRRYSVLAWEEVAVASIVFITSFFNSFTTSLMFLGDTNFNAMSMVFLLTSIDGHTKTLRMSITNPSRTCLCLLRISVNLSSTISLTLLSLCPTNKVTYACVAAFSARGEADKVTRDTAPSYATAGHAFCTRETIILKSAGFCAGFCLETLRINSRRTSWKMSPRPGSASCTDRR
mmetsp:Transcript_55289/g.108175  ORF Transcript_55289/g.108175 Transcript_55289/m.108175 type:complete len:215 (+) Transcript_55289:2438-3082(+)